MTFLMMLSVMLLSMLVILLSTLSVIRHLICGNTQNWLLNLYLIFEILWTGGRKWLVDFNTGKTQLVSFDRSNNTGDIDVKMDGSVLEEKSSFKMLDLTFSSKLDWGSHIISTAEIASKKIGALICSMKFLSLEVALYLCISINLPYNHAWNAVVMSWLLAATRNCWISYKNGYAGLLVLYLQPVLNLWLIVEMQPSLSLFYRYYFGRCSSELAELVPLPYS